VCVTSCAMLVTSSPSSSSSSSLSAAAAAAGSGQSGAQQRATDCAKLTGPVQSRHYRYAHAGLRPSFILLIKQLTLDVGIRRTRHRVTTRRTLRARKTRKYAVGRKTLKTEERTTLRVQIILHISLSCSCC